MLGGSDSLPPEIRRSCIRTSYGICHRNALLPKSLQIELCYDPTESAERLGGFADVWKGKHKGHVVAAKALRVYLTSDLEWTRKVGGAQLVASFNELTASHTVVLQGGRDMEDTSSPECVATVRCDDDQRSGSVCDGIGVDGEWEYQRVPDGASRCQSAEARMFLIQGLHPHLTLSFT